MKIRIVSTFNGKSNKFYDLWEKRKANGYSGHKVTIYDAVKMGLPVDIEKLRAAIDDPAIFAQEYECEPTDTSNVLLPYDLIALAESIDATEVIGADFWWERRTGEIICGVDFGRTTDPTVCWTLERIGDILWTREVLLLRNMNTADQIEILHKRFQKATRVCLDYTGPGIGFGDLATKVYGEFNPSGHQFGKVENVTFTVNTKREMFPLLRRQFEAPTKLRVPISREVREDLHAMQQVVKGDSYNYWAPRTRDGHSDRCTALALAVRAAGSGVPFAYKPLEISRDGGRVLM